MKKIAIYIECDIEDKSEMAEAISHVLGEAFNAEWRSTNYDQGDDLLQMFYNIGDGNDEE